MSDKKLARAIEKAHLSDEEIYPGARSYYFDAKKITDIQLNRLRSIIMDEIETLAFDEMIVTKNTAFDDDVTIMNYFEYVLLSDAKVSDKDKERIKRKGAKFVVNRKGDVMIKSDDIEETRDSFGVQVVGGYPLLWLRDNEELDVVLTAKYGTGNDCEKYKPVTAIFIEANAEEGKHKLTLESTGVYLPEEIYQKALNKLKEE